MKADEMQPVEPDGPCSFRSRESLLEHVEKHLICQRHERWHQVFPQEMLDRARAEYWENRRGQNLERLADAYESAVAAEFAAVCDAGQNHTHLCEYEWDLEIRERIALKQVIRAWPNEKKMFIVAKAVVRSDDLGAYTLRTAYRVDPRISGNAWSRKQRERVRLDAQLQTERTEFIIAEHVGSPKKA